MIKSLLDHETWANLDAAAKVAKKKELDGKPTRAIRKLCRQRKINWKKCIVVEAGDPVEKDLPAKAIKANLKAAEIAFPKNAKKAELLRIAKRTNVAYQCAVRTDVMKSWVGTPKGMLQVAYERGLLDLNKYCVEDYTENGQKDAEWSPILETSLKHLLAMCTDFVEEETLLQQMCKKMGAICDRSPKCHPELAGEGIEYSWGNAKMKYRRLKYSQKTSKKQFHNSVRFCLSRDFLSNERIRTNARRAREYIVAYYLLAIKAGNSESGELTQVDFNDMEPMAVSAQKIEQLKDMVRCHRAAIDFDTQFCNAVFKVGIPVVKQEKKRRKKKTIAGAVLLGLVALMLPLFLLMCIQ